MGDELVGFFEGSGVQQQLDALARREFAGTVLAFAALGATSLLGQGVAPFQFNERGCVRMTGMGIVHGKRNYRTGHPDTRIWGSNPAGRQAAN